MAIKKTLKISASSVSRIKKCPASAHLELKLKDKYRIFLFKDAAEFGTLVHGYAERLLLEGDLRPIVWSDINNHPRADDITYIIKYYNDAINHVLNRLGASVRSMEVEQKYRKTIDGVDNVAKCDVLVRYDNGVLVADLKTGRFDYSPSAYEQMKFSALLWLAKEGVYAGEKEIRTVTVQPMYYNEAYRVVETSEMISCDEVLRQLSMLAYTVKKGKRDFCIGSHCKFCPSILICPKLRTFIQEVETMAKKATKEDLDFQLLFEAKEAVTAFYDSLELYLKTELERGKVFPGIGLEEYSGHRRWIDYVTVEEKLAYLKDKIYEPRKLKTPAQIEKIAGKTNIEGLYESPRLKRVALKENPFEGV